MDFTNPYATVDVALIDLMRNLGVGLLLAIIWAFVISKTTRLIVDTRQYLPVFLLLIPSMILIITIIKSSIALSLGLVGALSIVRFRTPDSRKTMSANFFFQKRVRPCFGMDNLFMAGILSKIRIRPACHLSFTLWRKVQIWAARLLVPSTGNRYADMSCFWRRPRAIRL